MDTQKNDKDFFDELREQFTVEDFTCNVGTLLSDDNMDKEIVDANKFLFDIYRLAISHI